MHQAFRTTNRPFYRNNSRFRWQDRPFKIIMVPISTITYRSTIHLATSRTMARDLG